MEDFNTLDMYDTALTKLGQVSGVFLAMARSMLIAESDGKSQAIETKLRLDKEEALVTLRRSLLAEYDRKSNGVETICVSKVFFAKFQKIRFLSDEDFQHTSGRQV